MLKIAITGLPASGKSTVTKMFKSLGAEIIDADIICHSLFSPSETAYHEILNYFGKKCLNKNDTLNKDFLRHKLIFSPKDRKILENILHPKIYERIKKRIQELEKKGKIIIVEIPLLFEVGWEREFDFTIVVDADEDICIKRLISKGISEDEAKGLLSLHLSAEKKKEKADWVIENKSDLIYLYEQVKYVWQRLNRLTS